MNARDYLKAHKNDIGICAQCGEEITAGCSHYDNGCDLVHAECFSEYIEDHFMPHCIADALGFIRRGR